VATALADEPARTVDDFEGRHVRADERPALAAGRLDLPPDRGQNGRPVPVWSFFTIARRRLTMAGAGGAP
jgi:hypothetical protein